MLKSEVFSDCVCLPPSLFITSQASSFPPAVRAGGFYMEWCFTFEFQLAKLLAPSQDHDWWWVLSESLWVLAHPTQLGRREQAWPGHRLRGCDSASLLPESNKGQSWTAETSHSAESSSPVSPELKGNWSRPSQCTSYLVEDIPGKSQALLCSCLTNMVLEGCWRS